MLARRVSQECVNGMIARQHQLISGSVQRACPYPRVCPSAGGPQESEAAPQASTRARLPAATSHPSAHPCLDSAYRDASPWPAVPAKCGEAAAACQYARGNTACGHPFAERRVRRDASADERASSGANAHPATRGQRPAPRPKARARRCSADAGDCQRSCGAASERWRRPCEGEWQGRRPRRAAQTGQEAASGESSVLI